MALLHVDFFSESLGMAVEMDVILPQQTSGQIGMVGAAPAEKCQTLYLLHGMSDNQTIWGRRTSIERYVAEYGLAVVMPTTYLGWYTDMAHGLPYFQFVSKELVEVCQRMFPMLSEKREDTFVAGLSMGGYGALKLGLLASNTFSHAASLSGALDIGEICEHLPPGEERLFLEVFGDPKTARGSENDLFAAAEKLPKDERPRVFIWCGTEDFLYAHSARMHRHLDSLQYDLTYTQGPGDHQWVYWDQQIQTVLAWLPLRKEGSPWR